MVTAGAATLAADDERAGTGGVAGAVVGGGKAGDAILAVGVGRRDGARGASMSV
jgi:hypothetical protein